MLSNLRLVAIGLMAILAISSATVVPAMAASDYYLELDSFSFGASNP